MFDFYRQSGVANLVLGLVIGLSLALTWHWVSWTIH